MRVGIYQKIDATLKRIYEKANAMTNIFYQIKPRFFDVDNCNLLLSIENSEIVDKTK